MADTYVLVHGAWHTGELMEPVAQHLRAMGHTVRCPTLAGNRPGDDRTRTGLSEAARSLVEYVEQQQLNDVRLVGHSYGGMVISQAASALLPRLKRLVYWNAFVPLNGQCLNDLVPPHYVALFEGMAAANGNAVMLPYPIWRDAFINDADAALAERSYALLNPHPYRTFTEPASLPVELAALEVGKRSDGSYWARIEFRTEVGLTMSQWSCPNWAQLLADIDRKRAEYNCPIFPIEEPTAAHWT